jgi:hypothetical protein
MTYAVTPAGIVARHAGTYYRISRPGVFSDGAGSADSAHEYARQASEGNRYGEVIVEEWRCYAPVQPGPAPFQEHREIAIYANGKRADEGLTPEEYAEAAEAAQTEASRAAWRAYEAIAQARQAGAAEADRAARDHRRADADWVEARYTARQAGARAVAALTAEFPDSCEEFATLAEAEARAAAILAAREAHPRE